MKSGQIELKNKQQKKSKIQFLLLNCSTLEIKHQNNSRVWRKAKKKKTNEEKQNAKDKSQQNNRNEGEPKQGTNQQKI